MAVPRVERALPIGESLFSQALVWQQRGDLAQAEAVCETLLRSQPGHVDAWHLRGLLACQRGELERGIDFIRESLRLNPRQPAASANIGAALLQLKRADEALEQYDVALAQPPGSAATHFGRATALLELDRTDEALAAFDCALALLPTLLPALVGRGRALHRLQRREEASACYQRALTLAPDDADALFHRGDLWFDLRRYEAALTDYQRVLRGGRESVEVLNNCGNALLALSRHAQALTHFERAIALRPELPAAHCNRANVFMELGRLGEAMAGYEAALRCSPDFPAALDNLGLASLTAELPDQAAQAYTRLLQVAPDFELARSNVFHARGMCCDWSEYEADRDAVLRQVASDQLVHPFVLLAATDTPAQQLRCARHYFAARCEGSDAGGRGAVTVAPVGAATIPVDRRVRIGYVSADLREHAVSYLMAGVFEQHDRARFETFAFSLSPAEISATGERVRQAFDHFEDVSGRSDAEIATLMRACEIDIAIDLMGYTRKARPGVFARRAARVQVSYLGYPGTLGAPLVDYLVADDFVIPPAARPHYAEQVVYLPDCFQANDDRRVIGPTPARADCGLPESGTVLCSFNNSYKLSPLMFDIWMRLLQNVPGSVLWLLGERLTQANLRREAAARGVDPERLVFAAQLPYAQHLGRLRQADLFLDTMPYNGGTTASDALYVGVPVLTCAGQAFATRMAGSLLRALQLPELITHSLAEYEHRALELARDPGQLRILRAALMEQERRRALFDSARRCRQLEQAFLIMHERASAGQAPTAFAVTPRQS
jgi:predicted O-linked N-acetylglucosamine transferase (SPINDLY family)